MMCLQLPAVNKPSQHPGPHWLGWLRVAPRALHSIPPPSSISIFSPLIFHSYSFFFFPFLPLFSLFLFAVLFSFLFGVLSSFLPLTHLHIPHQPSILFTCFSLCICVYLTFWEPLHCMPIHIAPLLVVLVYRPAYTCISHNCNTRYNCLFLLLSSPQRVHWLSASPTRSSSTVCFGLLVNKQVSCCSSVSSLPCMWSVAVRIKAS